MFGQFWHSYGPWHLQFLHILACLLNSSYILAWIWMKLGRDVAPQVYKCMWGDNSCSANFDTVMVLDTYSFCTFQLVFSTPPTSLHGFEWNLAGMLHHKSTNACGEIIHVWPILAELWSLTLIIFTHFSLSSQLLLHPCMDLNETWQGCCTTSLQMQVGR